MMKQPNMTLEYPRDTMPRRRPSSRVRSAATIQLAKKEDEVLVQSTLDSKLDQGAVPQTVSKLAQFSVNYLESRLLGDSHFLWPNDRYTSE